MAAAYQNDPSLSPTKSSFSQIMTESSDRLLLLPRDEEGVPLFRVRHVAINIFYELVSQRFPDARTKIEGTPLAITVNFARMDKVCQQLMKLQRANEYPYNLPNAEVPNRSEDAMPPESQLERGSEQHAQFLWHACYWMAGGIDSKIAFQGLRAMYGDSPELFDPKYIVAENIQPEDIARELANYPALNFNTTRIQNYWIENARRVVARFDGDFRNIFADKPSYRTITKRLVNKRNGDGFLGFQEKMGSMYTHFLADAGIIPEIPFPPPVDFHLLRLATSLEILHFDAIPADGNIFEQKTIDTLRKALYDYIITTNTSELELDDALWRYSKLMCAQAPGNTSSTRRDENDTRYVTEAPVHNLQDEATQRRYVRSCGQCAVRQLCTSNIRSGDYYSSDRITMSPRTVDDEALIPLRGSYYAQPSRPRQY